MRIIKKLTLMTILLTFLVGCSNSDINSKKPSKEAIEKNTMTKVQNDVNVIMDKDYSYVLKNMGNPYSTVYSLKVDDVDAFKDLEKMRNVENIELLSKGLVYPKYTSDYKFSGSAIYIGLKDDIVNKVETCDFKNFDISQIKDKNANIAILKYEEYDSLSSESIDNDSLKSYIGGDKESISTITRHKQCQYSIYTDVNEDINIEAYHMDNDEFFIVVFENNSIIFIDKSDFSNLLSTLEKEVN